MSVARPGLRHHGRPGLQAWLENRLSTVNAMAKPIALGSRISSVSTIFVNNDPASSILLTTWDGARPAAPE
jgi:hypothetical protein